MKGLKIARFVTGIVNIVLSVLVVIQAIASIISAAMAGNPNDNGYIVGTLMAVLMLVGGVVSITTRNSRKGGYIATMIIYFAAAACGFSSNGVFKEVYYWPIWCVACGLLSLACLIVSLKTGNAFGPDPEEEEELLEEEEPLEAAETEEEE